MSNDESITTCFWRQCNKMNVFTEKHRKAALVVPTAKNVQYLGHQPINSATDRAPGRSFPRRGLTSTQRGGKLRFGSFHMVLQRMCYGGATSTNLHRAKSIRSSGVGMEIFTINADFNVNTTHSSEKMSTFPRHKPRQRNVRHSIRSPTDLVRRRNSLIIEPIGSS